MQGVFLGVVEVAYDSSKFLLKTVDADMIIQKRIERFASPSWQRERLLNIGIANLPTFCDKVAIQL